MQESTISNSDPSEFVTRDDQRFAIIKNANDFRPFLVNVVSASDLWMFLSSRGGLTAGRGSAQGSIFPYETVDRLHDAHHTTGPVCLLRLKQGNDSRIWNPFGTRSHGGSEYDVLKNVAGNQVVFDATDPDTKIQVTQRWTSAECIGHIRTVTIKNNSNSEVSFDFIDGVRNLLPWGVELSTQQFASCLVDAYKRNELDSTSGLAAYCLSSRITDRAEPAEALRVNVAWSLGLDSATITMSEKSLDAFWEGKLPQDEELQTGERGNYLVSKQAQKLGPGDSLTWHIVLDTGLDHVQFVGLRQALMSGDITFESVEQSVANAKNEFLRLIGTADGLQTSANGRATVHHFSNTTFNCMRGGLFLKHHQVPTAEFREFVQNRNKTTFATHQQFLQVLGETLDFPQLLAACRDQHDATLTRLCYEFLPLTFSRRHGDPSRPWNSFEIRLRDDDGNKVIHYEGNWRDIFQNWESTCTSFPQFFPGVIARFVNGSTADGFNPYRVTSQELEWEVPDPEDPWSHIGYWGDHQIIYLLKLVEAFEKHAPDELQAMLVEDSFAYLQVPYRLKAYGELVKDRRHTIDFDFELNDKITNRVAQIGEDGKLLQDKNGKVYVVNLIEKLLVPAMSKISSFVMGGGIWMNTQRPEWNDANNALVGNGISVVTLAHLHRYSAFVFSLCQKIESANIAISREVANWMHQICEVLRQNQEHLNSGVNDQQRRKLLDDLGESFSDYRAIVYDNGFSKRFEVKRTEIEQFFNLVRQFTEHTLLANEREDGLFHSYNLLEFSHDGSLKVKHLHEMLEGQVAAISSDALSCRQVIELVEQLFKSRMYRDDQHTFMLYPARELPDFIDRNVVPEKRVQQNPLLTALTKSGNKEVISEDAMGAFRFNGDFIGAADVSAALDRLAQDPKWKDSVNNHGADVVDAFCNIFQHYAYTGRSGTMYRYEGIGCIYWHMISKLLVAVQDTVHRAIDEGQDDEVVQHLGRLYLRIRRGLCFEKSPEEYGAFPTDPYSHTPGHTGAEQPGMTGQVKEGILARWGELGVNVQSGLIRFDPRLLSRDEFITEPTSFTFVDFEERLSHIDLERNELGFTYCQVPVIYSAADETSIIVIWKDARQEAIVGNALTPEVSNDVLGRRGQISQIRVSIDQSKLLC